MKTTPRIVMTYSCNQNWDAMSPAKDGRHCKACMTTVIDFTKMTVPEIKKYSENKGSLCGSFTIKQLEPELIEVSSVFAPLKKYVIVLFTLITTELLASNNQQSLNNTIEFTEIAHQNKKSLNTNENKTIEKNRSELITQSSNIGDYQYVNQAPKKRKKLYISKKFPFVHYRSLTVVGRFR